MKKISYLSHYEYLIKTHGYEEGLILYKKFLRSSTLETYIIKFGEKLGTEKFKQKKKGSSSLKYMIEKYGEIDGTKKYKKWLEGVSQSKDGFIKRYGYDEGVKRYEKFKQNCAIKDSVKNDVNSTYYNRKITTRLEYFIEKCNGDVDKAREMYKDRQATSTLEKFQKRYGMKLGLEKYLSANKKKSMSLKNFIRLYGEIKGSECWYNYINKLKYRRSKKYYIDTYGDVDGLKKWNELTQKKTTFFSNFRSKIGDEFCESLNNILIKNNLTYKTYYGDTEYMFFIKSNDFSVLYPDFIIPEIKLIVEFYGDYWHRNPSIYTDDVSELIRLKDEKRINEFKKRGYEVIIIWEYDYRKNKSNILNNLILKINKYEKN